MELPRKSLYSLPEAVDIIAKHYGVSFTLDDLVGYAKDGKVLFSILVNEEYLTALIEKHLENMKLGNAESAVREILDKAKKQPSGKIVVYLPPDVTDYAQCEFFRMFGTSTDGWAVPVEKVIVDPSIGDIRIPYSAAGVKYYDKQAIFMAAVVFDQGAVYDDYRQWFQNKEEVAEAVIAIEMVITWEQLETLLIQGENPEGKIPQKLPIQEKRELVLKGWAAGARLSQGELKEMELTHKQLWDVLGGIDSTIFPPASADTTKEFFQKQTTVEGFKKGRRKGG